MLCRVAQIQLSMLFPLCSNRTLPSRPALHTLTGRRTSQCRRRASKFNPKHAGKNSNRHSQKTPPTEPTRPLPILPMVQCSPFHPGLHSHLPSLHVPCSLQRGWHALWSHPVPIQPSSHRQVPDTQTPWPPQSAAQISVGDRDTERKKDKKKRVGEDRREEEDVEGGGGQEWVEKEDKEVTGQGNKGGEKDKSRSYCHGKSATLHYLVWWQLKRNSCTS